MQGPGIKQLATPSGGLSGLSQDMDPSDAYQVGNLVAGFQG